MIQIKGINYNAGIDYSGNNQDNQIKIKEFLSDLKFIKEMNCNAIRLYGSDSKKLIEYTKIAIENGFEVWVSPRYIGENKDKTIDKLLSFSKELEKLRKNKNKIKFIIGNEFSLDMKGIVKGETYNERFKNSAFIDHKKINSFFKEAIPKIRDIFKGEIIYASYTKEKIDLNYFDYIGLNYYWSFLNALVYTKRLKKLQKKYNKKIVITEFGTCSYKLASFLDGFAYYPIEIMNLHKKPILNKFIIRDEKEQIKYLKKCFKIFEKNKIYGTFIFDYAEKWKIHNKEKKEDRDLGSFGIMKMNNNQELEPKKAYHFIREFYKDK